MRLLRKSRTAFSLLAKGSFSRFRERWRLHLRKKQLAGAGGKPFTYSINGFKFVCTPGISDSEEVFRTGEADGLEFDILRRWLESGDTFVDVGTNLGLYSFCAHQHLQGRARIIAIEASPKLVENLKAAAELLGLDGIHFEELAVGNEEKEVSFYEALPGMWTGMQSLVPENDRTATYTPTRVQMTTLRTLMEKYSDAGVPNLVKVDIEGAELLGLRGAPSPWLGSAGPLWIVEVNASALERFGATCRGLVSFFPEKAFDLWLSPNYSKKGSRLMPLRRLTASESFDDAWFYNLIAVPKAPIFAERRRRLEPVLAAAKA
jgi:FkbM family methyltransferase